jgi:glyoxylase-like metal-dependent hydrolase (beta-lactamase superfamily II)
VSLKLHLQISGPLENNVIILQDETSGEGILFDPSFDLHDTLEIIDTEKITITSILFTHGHFDHFAGLTYLLTRLDSAPRVGLHPSDLPLWRQGGGASQFRIPIEPPAEPNLLLEHGQRLRIGIHTLEVRHTPGHSPGSVIFYIPAIQTAIVGDLIFYRGVGRTDLDGGSFESLRHSIETQVFTLPADTILVPGHGRNTSVTEEMRYNPYVGASAD